MRCKEHFQRDHCRKEAQHESEVTLKPDPVHVGSFSAWEGSGDSKKIVAAATFSKAHQKRNRRLNRFIAKAVLEARIGVLSEGDAKSLEACAKYLRGEKLA
jgi:hypothetical protein